jgi:hypothetical protein
VPAIKVSNASGSHQNEGGIEDEDYVMLIDNYSDFNEFDRLQNSEFSEGVIEKLKKWFAVHDQTQQVYSDNGPQYSSMEFNKCDLKSDWSG